MKFFLTLTALLCIAFPQKGQAQTESDIYTYDNFDRYDYRTEDEAQDIIEEQYEQREELLEEKYDEREEYLEKQKDAQIEILEKKEELKNRSRSDYTLDEPITDPNNNDPLDRAKERTPKAIDK